MAGKFQIRTLKQHEPRMGQPPAHKPELHAILTKRLDRARIHRWPLEIQWTLNLLFYRGHHWVHWDPFHNSFMTPKAPPYRVRHKNNQFKKMLHDRMGRIIRQRTKWAALPASGDTEDEVRAAADERWLQYAWRAMRMPVKISELATWITLTGNGALRIYWDKDAGFMQPREVRDQDGILQISELCPQCNGSGLDIGLQEQMMGMEAQAFQQLTGKCRECDGYGGPPQIELQKVGDVACEVVNPYNVFWEPGAKNAQDAEWVIIRNITSVQEARRKIPQAGKFISENNSKLGQFSVADAISLSMGTPGFTAHNSDLQSDRVEIFTYYGKPTDEHPKGRVYRFTRSFILEEFDNPFPQNGFHPLSWFTDFADPGTLYGLSAGNDLRPLQKEYNRLWSMLLEHGNHAANPVLLRSHDSITSQIKGYPMPGQVLEYHPAAEKPSYLQIPPMTADIAGMLERIKQDMREIALNVDRETAPSKMSGRLVALLKEEEEEANAQSRVSQKDAFEDAGQKALNIAKRMIDEERIFSIIGRSNTAEFGELRPGNETDMPSDVFISEGDVLPDSKVARIEVVNELAPFITDPETGMPDNKRILAMMDVGSEDIDRTKQEKDNAERENREMIKRPGEQKHISKHDDHKVHFDTHLKKARSFPVGHQTRLTIEAHMDMHQQMMMQAQAGLIQASQQQIAGGQSPVPGLGTLPGQQPLVDPTASPEERMAKADSNLEQFTQQPRVAQPGEPR